MQNINQLPQTPPTSKGSLSQYEPVTCDSDALRTRLASRLPDDPQEHISSLLSIVRNLTLLGIPIPDDDQALHKLGELWMQLAVICNRDNTTIEQHERIVAFLADFLELACAPE